jgi:CDP-diacylglycerol---glycerol-3-phosphate 3-phosphatidyltransferase
MNVIRQHNCKVCNISSFFLLGARSIQRDLECQLAIVTDNKELRSKFHCERQRLFQHGTFVTSATFKQLSRMAPFWGPLFMRIFRNFF